MSGQYRHHLVGPSEGELLMFEVHDHFDQLVEKSPQVAATFANEVLQQIKELNEVTPAPPAPKRKRKAV
jgi:hypothetical protein